MLNFHNLCIMFYPLIVPGKCQYICTTGSSTKVIFFLLVLFIVNLCIGLLYSLLKKEENKCIFTFIGALDVELQVVKVIHYGVISQFFIISKGSY